MIAKPARELKMDSRTGVLDRLEISHWSGPFNSSLQTEAVDSLEHGRVLYCPRLAFALEDKEKRFLSPSYLSGLRKNISYEPVRKRLGGASARGE